MSMIGDSKRRITINPPKDVVDKLDEMCKVTGLTRSAMASYMIIQGIKSYEVVTKFPEETLKKLAQAFDD